MKKIPFLLRHNLHTVKCTDLKCYSSMNLYIYINVDSQHLDEEVELSSTPRRLSLAFSPSAIPPPAPRVTIILMSIPMDQFHQFLKFGYLEYKCGIYSMFLFALDFFHSTQCPGDSSSRLFFFYCCAMFHHMNISQ